MCLCDAVYDGQAEARSGVVGNRAFRAPLKWLGERADHLRVKVLPGAIDREQHMLGGRAGSDPYGAVSGLVVDNGVV